MVVREVVIETDLAHRDHTRMPGQLPQLSPLGGTDGITRRVWMPSDRCLQARDALGQLDAGPVVRGIVTNV
jgi:hypothetical protein